MSCIVFDLGGVICRINQDWGSAMRQAGFDPGGTIEIPFDNCPGFTGYQRGVVEEGAYLDQLRQFLGLRTSEQAKTVHQAILIDQFEGANSLVARIRRAGHAIGVLSNTNHMHWQVLTDPTRFPIVAHADYAMASHLVRAEKPESAIFLAFETESGYRAEDMIFFDDHEVNVDGAKNCGWQAFLISHGSSPPEQIERYLMQIGIGLD